MRLGWFQHTLERKLQWELVGEDRVWSRSEFPMEIFGDGVGVQNSCNSGCGIYDLFDNLRQVSKPVLEHENGSLRIHRAIPMLIKDCSMGKSGKTA